MGVIAFTGTNTGNTYKVGQSYSMAGKTYVAQSNGTFATMKSDGTTRFTEGSSQSDSATFYVSQSLGAGGGSSRSSGAVNRGSGDSAASVTGRNPNTGQGPGSIPSAKGGAPSKVTKLWWDGVPLSINPRTSDGADFEDRWGEWGGGLGGIGVMADDLVFTPLRDVWTKAPAGGERIVRGFTEAISQGWGGQGTLQDDLAGMRKATNAISGGRGYVTGGGF